MDTRFVKANAAWLVPVAVTLLGGIGWLVKRNLELSRELATLVGSVQPAQEQVRIFVSAEEKAATSKTGWFRIEEVAPGTHEIQWVLPGYRPKFARIEIKGGTENRVTLPSLEPDVGGETDPIEEFIKVIDESHRWYAGTRYVGVIDWRDANGQFWQCSGGACVLEGPFGAGLSMESCQALVRLIGPLDYYYNDAGQSWTTTENHPLLDQCNGAATATAAP